MGLEWKGEVDPGDRKYLIYVNSPRLRPLRLTCENSRRNSEPECCAFGEDLLGGGLNALEVFETVDSQRERSRDGIHRRKQPVPRALSELWQA